MFKLPKLGEDIVLDKDKTVTLKSECVPRKIVDILGHLIVDDKITFTLPAETKFSLVKIDANMHSSKTHNYISLRVKANNCPEKSYCGIYEFSFDEFNDFAQQIG